jgi:anti-sigma B factor antagonist
MMELVYQQDNAHSRLLVSGEMTVSYMVAHKEPLLSYVRSHAYLTIDLAQVSQIDTAGVQMIMLLKKESHDLGGTVLLTGHSQAVRELVGLLRLEVLFDLEESMQ